MTPENHQKIISIVVPVYYNEDNLHHTITELMNLSTYFQGYKLELVFIDDGSGDDSLRILLEYQSKFSEFIKVVKLTRNFGSMSAVQAGFSVSDGDCVGVIAADLQDPPFLFTEMVKHWEMGNKAIFAVRQDREESIVQKIISNGYYALIRRFAIRDYPSGGFDFFLIDRQVLDAVNHIHEKNTNLMTLIFWLGYKPVIIPYVRSKRLKGRSRWTMQKKIKLFIDTFVAFTFIPIRALTVAGLLVALGSFLYGAILLIYWFFLGVDVKGYVPTILLLTLTSGIQMTMLGVLGEYLWRTLDEVRGRPSYVIDQIYGSVEHPKNQT